MEKELLLSARGICKAFGPTRALIDVDFALYRGEVHGLIGENGSGKSTFSSIVAGAQPCDSGSFQLKGQDYMPKNMVDAQNHGVGMIVQEQGTIGTLDSPIRFCRHCLQNRETLLFANAKNMNLYLAHVYIFGWPYSRTMASEEITHCLPYLQTSTPLTSLP